MFSQTQLPSPDSLSLLHSQTFLQRGGYNSEVLFVIQAEGGEKKIVKRIGALRGGFPFAVAEEIIKDIIVYQGQLELLGVPIPPIERPHLTVEVDGGRTHIVLTSPWTGNNIEVVMKHTYPSTPAKRSEPLIRSLCQIVALVGADRISDWECRLGFDPKPSNFTRDEDGKIWYIDPYPARFRKNGKAIIEWKELQTELGRSLGYFKYFDLRGIFLSLSSQLARIRPELKEFFDSVVLDEVSHLVPPFQFEMFRAELEDAPWRHIRRMLDSHSPSQDIQRAICQSLGRKLFGVDYNVYTLREIALELARTERMSIEELETFFNESHFEEEMPPERLQYLKNVLCRYLST